MQTKSRGRSLWLFDFAVHFGLERNQIQPRFPHTFVCIFLTAIGGAVLLHLLTGNNLMWMLKMKN